MTNFVKYRTYWKQIVDTDVEVLQDKDVEYGGSWKKRGGVGAFMMLARKWDRIEEQVTNPRSVHQSIDRFDILEIGAADQRDEGILDDIQDLRRYLINVEAEILALRESRDGHEPTDPTV